MVAMALLGGFVTASVGSGSDIALYAFGIYVSGKEENMRAHATSLLNHFFPCVLEPSQGWNVIYPENRFSENKFTASSVVVMGAMSGLTAATRALNGGFSEKVILCTSMNSLPPFCATKLHASDVEAGDNLLLIALNFEFRTQVGVRCPSS